MQAQNPVYRVASLWIRPGSIAAFEAYERKAARIMRKYGGSIEKAVRIGEEGGSEHPFEIHVVSFPDQDRFAAYRADPEVAALAPEREAVILKTIVVSGIGGPSYAA
ncbi:MAG TPA: DUF1330 domain-containing protein [Burkholderiales bacterium]|nr:DUF1330 domain-containing protein [Burkholderiales bacterium]